MDVVGFLDVGVSFVELSTFAVWLGTFLGLVAETQGN